MKTTTKTRIPKAKQRKFNGIPVREATVSLHVQPNKEDIKGATKEDPENCAYARCLKRTLECQNVFVFRTVAYIETLDEKGDHYMVRYHVRSYARDYLLRFDGGQLVEPGGFVFHAIPKSMSLDAKMRQYHERRTAGKTGTRGKGIRPDTRNKVKSYNLRNGKGAVHFITAEQIKVNREK
jgi:hypothetical protein